MQLAIHLSQKENKKSNLISGKKSYPALIRNFIVVGVLFLAVITLGLIFYLKLTVVILFSFLIAAVVLTKRKHLTYFDEVYDQDIYVEEFPKPSIVQIYLPNAKRT